MVWCKNGEEITSEKYKISFVEGTASLELSQLELCDAGIYICKATNSAGSKESKGTLSVKGLVHIPSLAFFNSNTS